MVAASQESDQNFFSNLLAGHIIDMDAKSETHQLPNSTPKFTRSTPKFDASKPPRITDHSTLWGVSIRGWIAAIVVLTVCGMSMLKIPVNEPLYTLAGLVVGFYFGQNPKKSA